MYHKYLISIFFNTNYTIAVKLFTLFAFLCPERIYLLSVLHLADLEFPRNPVECQVAQKRSD